MEAVKGGDDDDDKIQKISGVAAAGSKNASSPSMRDPNSILLWMGLSKGFDNKLNCMENALRENIDVVITTWQYQPAIVVAFDISGSSVSS